MTENFPEFYVSRPPEDAEDTEAVYYKVTEADPDGHVFWQQQSMARPKEDTFYDLFLEQKNGFGVTRIEKSETPWSE
jgi:hypothetical protein